MIGFRMSSFRQGCVSVGSPSNIKTVPDLVQIGVQKIQNFIKNVSKYEPYDPMGGEGNPKAIFRKLSIRQTSDQMMLILTISGGVC